MSRLLLVPAAGMGTRLGGQLPKLLVPVAGMPMIDRVLAIHASYVDDAVIVVNPQSRDRVEAHLAAGGRQRIECVVQSTPTGMLDAVLLARPVVEARRPEFVWITWCDQLAVHPDTVRALASWTSPGGGASLVLPTVRRHEPYIHFDRDASGRIAAVRQRREGDIMPEEGESDMGLFALSADAFLSRLPEYEATIQPGAETAERNFLPFIPWLARRAEVVTFDARDPMEAIGVNTPEELLAIEAYLLRR